MSHTHGPWEVGDKRGVWVGPVVMAGNGSRGVAFVCGESDANARLISAAPDLLASLKAIVEASQFEGEVAWLEKLWPQVNAALDKAEGTDGQDRSMD